MQVSLPVSAGATLIAIVVILVVTGLTSRFARFSELGRGPIGKNYWYNVNITAERTGVRARASSSAVPVASFLECHKEIPADCRYLAERRAARNARYGTDLDRQQ